MSLPTVPNITPTITINTNDAFNLLLISIALEEIALAHIINAEGEKIQFVLGTLHDHPTPPHSIDDVLRVNKDVRATLNDVIRKEMLLQMKLEAILDVSSVKPHPHNPCPPDVKLTSSIN